MALEVAAECPGTWPHASWTLPWTLQAGLEVAPQAGLCVEALKLVPKLSQEFLRPPVSDVCAAAQMRCGADPRCRVVMKEALLESITPEQVLQRSLELCHEPYVFHEALEVLAECPGPWFQQVVHQARDSLLTTPAAQLCQQAQGLVKSKVLPTQANIDMAFSVASEVDLLAFAASTAERLVTTFDALPHDGKLNALEFEALRNMSQQNKDETIRGEWPRFQDVDINKDQFVTADELETAVRSRIRPKLLNEVIG